MKPSSTNIKALVAMAVARSLTRRARPISSLGFSGAGFLACYHLGVAQCLIDHGIVSVVSSKSSNSPSTDSTTQSSTTTEILPPLCGVSAGALIAASLAAGVDPRAGMQAVLQVSARARQAGRFNVLQPGFSLVDVMEEYVTPLLKHETDTTAFMRRIDNGKKLRIGLTDRRRLRQGRENAFVYVDQYRDMDDVIAACVLSSYVPGITGPALGSLDSRNLSISRSMKRLEEMFELGAVKSGATHQVVKLDHEKSVREFCWDGGIANCFPYYDKDTTIVTPLAVDFQNHRSINPSIEDSSAATAAPDVSTSTRRYLQLNPGVRMHLSHANGLTWRHISWGSIDDVLLGWFDRGHANATTYLIQESASESASSVEASSRSAATATSVTA
jgi:predicted acylesterase/phospholipase RssA